MTTPEPLTPTPEQMAAFWGSEAPVEDANWLEQSSDALQQATDLLWLVTGITDAPTDQRQLALLRYAIMDMAIFMFVQNESLAESYSTFSGERIGSYNYSKSFRQGAASGQTGVFWWDTVIGAVLDGNWDDVCSNVFSVDGEQVFHRGFTQWDPTERLLHRAPLSVAPGVWENGLFRDPSPGADRWEPGATSDDSWAGDPTAWPY